MSKVLCAEPKSVVLSLSPKGYAAVVAAYNVKLTKGQNEVVLQGLPSTIVAESLDVDDELTGGDTALALDAITLLPATESLAEVDALLKGAKAILQFGEKGGSEVEGTIRLKSGSEVLLQTTTGLRRVQGVVGYTLPQTPDGLTDTPYLALQVTSEADGEFQLVLIYNAEKLSYSLAHAVVYDEKNGKLTSFKTSVVINNGTGTTFDNAQVYIVAGDTGDEQADEHGGYETLEAAGGGGPRMAAAFTASVAKSAVRRSASSVSLGGNAVSYPLPNKVSLRAGSKTKPGQTKLTLLQASGAVPVDRVNYVAPGGSWWCWEGHEQEVQPKIQLSFPNTKASNFGERVPAGHVTFKVRNAEKFLQTSGGTNLGDSAVGETIELSPGNDFDIKVTRKQVKDLKGERVEVKREAVSPYAAPSVGNQLMVYPRERITYRTKHTVTGRYELTNGKDHEVVVTIDENFGEHKLVGPHNFTKEDKTTHQTKITLGHTDEDRSKTVDFTVEYDETTYEDIQHPAVPAPGQAVVPAPVQPPVEVPLQPCLLPPVPGTALPTTLRPFGERELGEAPYGLPEVAGRPSVAESLLEVGEVVSAPPATEALQVNDEHHDHHHDEHAVHRFEDEGGRSHHHHD